MNSLVETLWEIGCNSLTRGGEEVGWEMTLWKDLTTLVPTQDNHRNVNQPGPPGLYVGRDNSVGIATRYGLEVQGIESRWGRDFPRPSRPALGAHPASYTMGTGSFVRVKRPGRDIDHPPHLAPRLKKE